MTGRALQEALEHAVYRYSDAIGRGEFLQMSGIRVVYDLTKETCQRVVSVSILCTSCSTPTYTDLDPNQKYGVIITSFLYEGGDGFTMFQVYKRMQRIKWKSQLTLFPFHRISRRILWMWRLHKRWKLTSREWELFLLQLMVGYKCEISVDIGNWFLTSPRWSGGTHLYWLW